MVLCHMIMTTTNTFIYFYHIFSLYNKHQIIIFQCFLIPSMANETKVSRFQTVSTCYSYLTWIPFRSTRKFTITDFAELCQALDVSFNTTFESTKYEFTLPDNMAEACIILNHWPTIETCRRNETNTSHKTIYFEGFNLDFSSTTRSIIQDRSISHSLLSPKHVVNTFLHVFGSHTPPWNDKELQIVIEQLAWFGLFSTCK